MMGREKAVRSYRLCLEAIASLEKLIANLGDTCGFQRKKCLYLAQRENEITQLKKEFLARKRQASTWNS